MKLENCGLIKDFPKEQEILQTYSVAIICFYLAKVPGNSRGVQGIIEILRRQLSKLTPLVFGLTPLTLFHTLCKFCSEFRGYSNWMLVNAVLSLSQSLIAPVNAFASNILELSIDVQFKGSPMHGVYWSGLGNVIWDLAVLKEKYRVISQVCSSYLSLDFGQIGQVPTTQLQSSHSSRPTDLIIKGFNLLACSKYNLSMNYFEKILLGIEATLESKANACIYYAYSLFKQVISSSNEILPIEIVQSVYTNVPKSSAIH